jgi:putative heme-binding domain-containing protein
LQALAQDALARGDAARGERLYRRTELACVACHAIGGAGGRLGPDLTSIGASAPADYLVESMLNPAAKIKEGYHAMLLTTADGQEHSGMVVREAAGEVVLRNAANQLVTLPARTITRRTSIGSLMPSGLLDNLLPEERLDLFRFLMQLGKPGDYDAARGGVARLWRLYNVVSANQHLGAERVVQGDFALEHWVSAFSLVSGRLPAEAFATAFNFRQNSRGLYVATQFDAPRAGPVTFTLEGEATSAWVNGRLVRPGTTFTAEAQAGTNVVVLQVDAMQPPAGLRLAAPGVAFRTE